MLSGGLDSTSVISCITTLLASQPNESRMVGDTVQAFTAGFPGLKNDETKKVEDFCRLTEIGVHQIFPANEGEIEKCLTRVAWNSEAPFYSPVVIVHDMLMKLVRSTDIRVTLDGTGSDELFGGYDWYIPLAIRDSFHSLRICEAMGNIEGWRSKHGKSWLIGIEHSLFSDLPRPFVQSVVGLGRGIRVCSSPSCGPDTFLLCRAETSWTAR